MIYRNADLLAAVRTLDCVHCGKSGRTQAAHSNQLRFGKGKSIKGSDAAIMALCCTVPGQFGCHAELDQGHKMTKAEKQQFEFECIAVTLIRLIEKGILVVQK